MSSRAPDCDDPPLVLAPKPTATDPCLMPSSRRKNPRPPPEWEPRVQVALSELDQLKPQHPCAAPARSRGACDNNTYTSARRARSSGASNSFIEPRLSGNDAGRPSSRQEPEVPTPGKHRTPGPQPRHATSRSRCGAVHDQGVRPASTVANGAGVKPLMR